MEYGSGLWSTDPNYGIRIRIMEYGSGLWNTDRDNFGNDRLKMDKDLPHSYTDNFFRDEPSNNASPQILEKCALDEV